MRGAIIFIVAFLAAFTATVGYPNLPVGRQIYDALNLPQTDYPVGGIPATTFACAVINGVIYGIIAWLAFTVLQKTGKI